MSPIISPFSQGLHPSILLGGGGGAHLVAEAAAEDNSSNVDIETPTTDPVVTPENPPVDDSPSNPPADPVDPTPPADTTPPADPVDNSGTPPARLRARCT